MHALERLERTSLGDIHSPNSPDDVDALRGPDQVLVGRHALPEPDASRGRPRFVRQGARSGLLVEHVLDKFRNG